MYINFNNSLKEKNKEKITENESRNSRLNLKK